MQVILNSILSGIIIDDLSSFVIRTHPLKNILKNVNWEKGSDSFRVYTVFLSLDNVNKVISALFNVLGL